MGRNFTGSCCPGREVGWVLRGLEVQEGTEPVLPGPPHPLPNPWR